MMNKDLKNILWTARWHVTKGDAPGTEKWITHALEKIGVEKSSIITVTFFETAKKKALADHLWTARWGARKNNLNVSNISLTEALVLIGAEKAGSHVVEPINKPASPIIVPITHQTSTFTGKQGQNIIPFATQMPSNQRMKTKGVFAKKYPSTLLVHFSAGQWDTLAKAKSMMNWGRGQGYVYLGIAYDGTLLQAHNINEWGHHAGTSGKFLGSLPFVGTVSDETIGVEVLNPGRLTERKDGRLESWYGEIFEKSRCRYVTEKMHGCPTGWYLPFSKAQEDMIIKTALWLYDNDPFGVFSLKVVGHHEVSGVPGLGYWRKNDPGGALSMPMDVLRSQLLGLRGLQYNAA